MAIGNYAEDTTIWPAMEALSACLCAELAVSELLPDDCFCGILPGSQVTWDYGNGMAWVRLVNAFPSNTFPVQENTMRGSCQAPLAAELEIGVLNCAPGISSTGVLPTQAEQVEASRLQIATMAAMRRAILCCGVGTLFLGAYTPLGPQGLVGGAWQIFVGEN